MNRLIAPLVVFVALCMAVSVVRAELVYHDDVLRAVESTGNGLAAGKGRTALLSSLEMVITANPKTDYITSAKSLAADLRYSIEQEKKLPHGAEQIRKHPERYLMDSVLPVYLVAYKANWGPSLKDFRTRNPNDPAAYLLTSDRIVIERLIPLLDDRSPIRWFENFLRGVPQIPRTCDYALLLIEFHSRCRFHDYSGSGAYFHLQSDEQRRSTIQHIKRWWKQNNMSTTAAGIRNLLQSGWPMGKIEMCQSLVEVGDADDAEFAKHLLRAMANKRPGHIRAARAMAEYGDLSPLEMYYEVFSKALDKPGIIHDSSVVFYMTDYGGRREWELLTKIAEREIAKGLDAGIAGVWPALVNCGSATTSRWAIPGLSLALTQTKASGSRIIAGIKGSQSFSYADKAAEYLQKQTGEDFGYLPAASLEKRMAAIRRAQQWWSEKGKSDYTFDAIQRRELGER